MGGLHSRLGPSNHRWPNCPGSVKQEAQYPDETNKYAIDGTGSHLLLELCLNTKRLDVRADEWLQRTIGEGHEEMPMGWHVDQERCDRVQMALDYIKRRHDEINVTLVKAESLSNPGECFGRDDWWGTVDITLSGVDKVTGQHIIEVIDYKDGRGYVSEKNNSQLISYAGGRLGPMILNRATGEYEAHQDKLVRMTIIQPKTNIPVRYQEMEAKELWSKVKSLAIAAKSTDHPNAPLIASQRADGWCQWCKHKGACSASTAQAMEGVAAMTSNTEGGDLLTSLQSGQISPVDMTDEQISAILDAAALITKMIENVKVEAQTRLEAGNHIPGYKMGSGPGKSTWRDDEEVVAAKLKGMRVKKGDIYPAKLISPAAAKKLKLSEKQLKKLEEMIGYSTGKPTVVKSVTEVQDATSMFMGVTETTEQVEQAPAATMSFL